MRTAAVLLLALLFLPIAPDAWTPPAKPIEFPGFAVTDSLDYSARSIDYSVERNRAIMRENASANYLGYVLKSNSITYYQNDLYIAAEGRRDSTGALVDTPVFVDKGSQELRGRIVEYDMRSGEGLVTDGNTKYDNGFMTFRKVKRVSSDTLFIADGTYTTCDLSESPHYYFAGSKMKLIVDDKLIIKPITAYIYHIPVFWFPFYVFPITKGRQSGFLTPRYGSSRQDGRYLSNVGYYVAASDFWDYRAAGTLRERNGWLVKNWVNYNARYRMNGSVYASFEDRTRGSRQWLLQASHAQAVSPTLQITGDANFQSSQFSRFNSYNIYDRLNRDMRSSLTITKRWKESGNSLITNLSHYKNLDTKNTSMTLPNISFRKPRKLLFGAPERTVPERKYVKRAEEEKSEETRWYESIYYSFSSDFKNTGDRSESYGIMNDTFSRDLRISTSLSSSNHIRGWLVAEPSLNLNEAFAAKNSVKDSLRYQRGDNLTVGVTLGTTVYGTFQPKIGNVTGLRHVISPSVTWSFGKNREYKTGSADAFFRFDRKDASRGKVNGLDLNLRNIFQLKTLSGDKENKTDLFTLNFSSSVDLEDKERKIAPVYTALDFRPMRIFSTRLSASHTLYRSDGRFDLLSPTMEQFSLTTDVGLTRESLRFMGTSSGGSENSNRGRDDLDLDTVGARSDEGIGASPASVPFNLRLSHTYSIRKAYGRPGKYTTYHDIKPEISFSPSPGFTANYYLYYDVVKKELVSHRASLYRDLHCFEAYFVTFREGASDAGQNGFENLCSLRLRYARILSRF